MTAQAVENAAFRKICLQALDVIGRKNEKTHVWMISNSKLMIMYEAGRLTVQDIVEHITVWDDRYSGPCTVLTPYYEMLERWMVLERLAAIDE